MGPEEEFELHNRQNSWHALFDDLQNLSSERHESSSKDARRPKFRSRNRYADVSPYDHSRVRLLRNNIDYINASLVIVPVADRSYILTQGPLKETSGHFWLMVWEQNSHAVIMLNRIIEKEQVKCYQYYPVGPENEGDGEMVFNDVGLKVTFVNERHTNYHFTTRVLQLQDLQSEECREVLHFHYTAWPDFRVPESPTAFLDFLFALRQENILSNPDSPAVIHCSAGIGRSGTICLVDTCLVLAAKNGGDLNSVSVTEVLLEMRQFRMGLIQTADQLRFSYLAIIEGARRLFSTNANIVDNEVRQVTGVNNANVDDDRVNCEATDDKEINATLDDFSQMLSDYSDDGAAAQTDSTPSPAQARLESLFLPPTVSTKPLSPGALDKEKPSSVTGGKATLLEDLFKPPTVAANTVDVAGEVNVVDEMVAKEKEAKENAEQARRAEREERKRKMEEKIADIKRHQRESEQQGSIQPWVIGAVSVAVAVLGYVIYHYVT